MHYLLYWLKTYERSKLEDNLWLLTKDVLEDFDIPTNKGSVANFDNFKAFLDINLKKNISELILLISTIILDVKRFDSVLKFLHEVKSTLREYRIPIHLFPALLFPNREFNHCIEKLTSDDQRYYIFSGNFADGTEVGDEIYLLFEYFIKAILNFTMEERKRFLQSKGICAFGCASIEYPLRKIANISLLNSYSDFNKYQLETKDSDLIFPLTLDFSAPIDPPPKPDVSNPFKDKEFDQFMFLANKEFNIDNYAEQITSRALMNLRNLNIKGFSEAFNKNWDERFNKHLDMASISKFGSWLRGGKGLSSLKRILLEKVDDFRYLIKLRQSESLQFLKYGAMYKKFQNKLKGDLDELKNKINKYIEVQSIKKYLSIFFISFIILTTLLFLLINKVPIQSRFLRVIYISGIVSFFLCILSTYYYRLYKIRKASEAANTELKTLATNFDKAIQNYWDLWISPQKKYIEGIFKNKALDYFKFYLETLISQIEIYENEIRAEHDIEILPKEKIKVLYEVKINEEDLQDVSELLLQKSKDEIDWNKHIYQDFEQRLSSDQIRRHFENTLKLFKNKLVKRGRGIIKIDLDKKWHKSGNEKLARLVGNAKRNILLRLKKDYKPSDSFTIVYGPKEFIRNLGMLRLEGCEILGWPYKEAICATVFYSNILDRYIIK